MLEKILNAHVQHDMRKTFGLGQQWAASKSSSLSISCLASSHVQWSIQVLMKVVIILDYLEIMWCHDDSEYTSV